jgi:hypothetical protein
MCLELKTLGKENPGGEVRWEVCGPARSGAFRLTFGGASQGFRITVKKWQFENV